MIYIAERHVEDYLHVLANVNTVRIFRKAFPHEKICFISARAHNIKVSSFFKENSDPLIEFVAFNNRRPVKNIMLRALSLAKRGFDDVLFFKRLFDNSSPADVLIVSHIYPHSLILFNLLKRFYSNRVVLLMLHGEVEYTLFAHNKAQKLIGLMYKISFRLTPCGLNYIFLTKAAAGIMANAGFNTGANPVFIELPTIVTEQVSTETGKTSYLPVKIGHIGSAGKRKNVDQLYVLADKVKDAVSTNRVQLSVVGILEASIKSYLNPFVVNLVNDQINQPIDRDIYDREVSQLDYAIFFYGLNDFLLRSSAAFFDAVLYEKPIIAFRNRFFTELFETYGPMGYLCDSLDAMQALIYKLVSEHQDASRQVLVFKSNIKAYKSTLGIGNIAADLKKQLDDLLPDAMIKQHDTTI